jgi:hypothetical protein
MLLSIIFIVQTIITLDKPIAQDAFEFKLIKELRLDNEFYERTYTAIAPNGNLIVVDKGNSRIKIIDSNNKVIHVFGREGFGPNELIYPYGVYITEKNYIVNDSRHYQIYNYNNELIREISNEGANLVVTDSNLMVINRGITHIKYFTHRGEFIREASKTAEYYTKNINYSLPKFTRLPISPILTPLGFIANYFGDYVVEIRDLENNKIKYIIKRDVREQKFYTPKVIFQGKPTKKDKEKIAKLMVTNIERADIHSVLGNTPYGFLVRLGSERDVLRLDLISYDLSYLALLEFYFGEDRLTYAAIQGDKLILDLKNDEIGPYVQIFELQKKTK